MSRVTSAPDAVAHPAMLDHSRASTWKAVTVITAPGIKDFSKELTVVIEKICWKRFAGLRRSGFRPIDSGENVKPPWPTNTKLATPNMATKGTDIPATAAQATRCAT